MPLTQEILKRDFYERDTKAVAQGLLGKRLVRRMKSKALEGIIVETEAYYGLRDPASRAYRGLKEYNRLMWEESGRVFIYNVHRYWMLNVVAHELGDVGAVLIRALEPTAGIDTMLANRPVPKTSELTSGPGKLTTALGIDKRTHGADVTDRGGEVYIASGAGEIEVGTSHRIGVTRDLPEELRFYIRGNPFLSRRR
jgi:DNA-3-methyladenine glycosylase